ncbi:unnamed protein product [Phytophthora fragariaefolia]|uniref:Unnamed protein product n=1 Tax=Phytophthora fragariaefolia TaxID=1490495 RepID=A0A9W6XX08_9STRA|nr:unnamed protein product [Phytophthora fragariaefolia]
MPLSSYVVASVGDFAAAPDLVQCRRGADTGVGDVANSVAEGRVLYEQACSPYASTRVVEGGTSPSWNEVLAIPLPPGWSEPSPDKQQRRERGDATGAGAAAAAAAAAEAVDVAVIAADTHLGLKLELVERGASHQEDFLLATCILPLINIGCQLQQARFGFAFPPVDSKGTLGLVPIACIYVSLHASPRDQISNWEQVEIMVESFTPVVITGSEDEGLPPDCTSLATAIHLETNTTTNPPNVHMGKLGVLENLFTLLHDGQALALSNVTTGNVSGADAMLGVTPLSSSATGSASGIYEWFFPFNFAVPAESNQDTCAATVNIALFKFSTSPHKLIGRGHFNFSSAPSQTVKKDGSPLRHTVIPIELDEGNSRILGHIALRLRWWSATAWKSFVDDSPSRRVICTNRWKRSPRPIPTWMGALLRGLNRHPVASICDSGGVSSILAELLAESSSHGDGESKQDSEHVSMENPQQHHPNSIAQSHSKESGDTIALLREQLAHLQAEGTAQRLQIERLQGELDTRLAAIKTCGLEIVALRVRFVKLHAMPCQMYNIRTMSSQRAARQKDEYLQKLKEQVEAAQRRDQQQLAELLAPGNGSSGAFPMQQAASQRFTLLASKYKELDQEHQAVKQQLSEAQQSLDSYAEFEARYAKLQEAHLVQAALVQRLQRDKQHAAALKTVAQQSAEAPKPSSPRQHAPSVEPSGTSTEDSSEGETREALLRVRVQVLEQQLQTNAREAATEMSRLRMRILELETAGGRRPGK